MPNAKERIGVLRERCTLQSYTVSQSTSGHETVTYADEATVWCKVEYKANTSQEEQQANRKTTIGNVVFTMRKEYSIDTKKRIVYNSETYDILNVSVTPDQFYHVIEAEKRV